MNIGQPEIASLRSECQPLVIDAERTENGCIDVVDVGRILDDVVTEVIRVAVRDLALDASAGHPDTEASAMMISAIRRQHPDAKMVVHV